MSSSLNSCPAIIIDNGQHRIKCGLAGDFEPQITVKPEISRHKICKDHTQMYTGGNIIKSPKGSVISNIFKDENNLDWQALEKTYQHLIYDKLELNDGATNHKFLLTQTPNTSTKTKTKLTQLLFETFDCNGLYFGMTSSLSLYAHGLTSGVAVDSGYKQTIIAPVFEGYTMPLYVKRLNYGGQALDEFLKNLLVTKHPNYKLNLSECEEMKVKSAYASMDFFEEESDATDGRSWRKTNDFGSVRFLLPDGNAVKVIDVNAERFQCVELLFQPNLCDNFKNEESLPYAISKCITKNERALQKIFFQNIVMCGGNSMISGLKVRLQKDVMHLSPASMNVQVHGSPQRNIAAFTGGSILAEHSEMKDIWITPQMYQEYGAECLTIRCF